MSTQLVPNLDTHWNHSSWSDMLNWHTRPLERLIASECLWYIWCSMKLKPSHIGFVRLIARCHCSCPDITWLACSLHIELEREDVEVSFLGAQQGTQRLCSLWKACESSVGGVSVWTYFTNMYIFVVRSCHVIAFCSCIGHTWHFRPTASQMVFLGALS